MTAFARLEPRSVDVIITRVPTIIFALDAPRGRDAPRVTVAAATTFRDLATTRTDDARDAKVTAEHWTSAAMVQRAALRVVPLG
jgi:hypothetical protein